VYVVRQDERSEGLKDEHELQVILSNELVSARKER
jgi:hypothetical protein